MKAKTQLWPGWQPLRGGAAGFVLLCGCLDLVDSADGVVYMLVCVFVCERGGAAGGALLVAAEFIFCGWQRVLAQVCQPGAAMCLDKKGVHGRLQQS